MRRKIALAILGLFLVVDVLAWTATYRAATAPSAEELARRAGALPDESETSPSSVEQIGDGLYHEIPLGGEWRYRQTGSELADYFSPDLDVDDWRTMTIPQNWYLAGLNYHGVIWFRRQFQADESWRGRVVRLRFGGVDYLADVWLNGEHLGHHEGYFQPFTFDVSGRLNYGGTNTLAVRVESPYEERRVAWPHRKTSIKGVFAHHATRPGGAWDKAGQEYNTGGLWNDVSLLVSDFVTVDDFRLQATWPTTVTTGADANVRAYVTLRHHANDPVEAQVTLTLTPRNFDGDEIVLPPQTVALSRGKTTLELDGVAQNPRLWWPWDRGHPNLYTARVAVAVDGRTVAGRETNFGFRQIVVRKDWTWILNGQRFFPRGANYISAQWLSETDEEWFRRDVELMRQANLNFCRLPAHVEPAAFYEAADELGVLVWQEFPLQWGYTDAPAFVDEAQRQMRDMIELLYNHPSIVVWCAHNESPWDSPEIAARMNDYDPRQNKRLDELLRDLALELDPTRYAHVNSGTGDEHVYAGWSQGRWRAFASRPDGDGGQETSATAAQESLDMRFITEYGAQALPNLEMMQQIFAPEELNYDSGEIRNRWEFHDFQPLETFNVAGIDRGESVDEFIANSQTYQAHLIQFATENYRRARYSSIQGIFYATFVDNWPSITWSVLDYDRQPKDGFYALQTAMQPILPSIDPALPERLEGRRWVYESADEVVIALWVVNDTLDEYPNAELCWRIQTGAGESVTGRAYSVDILPDGVQRVVVPRNLDLAPGDYDMYVELLDAEGRELGRNEFAFAIVPPPEE
jgi:beta-mannosidase